MRRVLLRHFQSLLGPGTVALARHGVYGGYRALPMRYRLREWGSSVQTLSGLI